MPGLIFVFGSNLAGRHGKGAALTARRQYGAIQGVAEGLMGWSYALPTCDGRFNALPLDTIKVHVDRFLELAKSRQDLLFGVTRVGCGLAHYRDKQIAPMFEHAPSLNVLFDELWRPYLGDDRHSYWGTF